MIWNLIKVLPLYEDMKDILEREKTGHLKLFIHEEVFGVDSLTDEHGLWEGFYDLHSGVLNSTYLDADPRPECVMPPTTI